MIPAVVNRHWVVLFLFFVNDTATTEIYTLSLHDALPICATGMLGLVNQFHSASLSERVTYRMRSGAQSGRHLHLAMLGYLNGTLSNGVKNLVPDPERAELVRKAF